MEQPKGEEPLVSVVIPVYNESTALRGSFRETLRDIGTCIPMPFEIIAVDDGSSDDSGALLRQEGLRVISHKVNRGYGAALKSGLAAARGAFILIVDADATYDFNDMRKLIPHIGQYDMVIGDRGKQIATLRKIPKWFLTKLASYLAERKIPDLNSGMRVFKKDIAIKYLHILPDRFSFTSTITLAMICDGYDVLFVPITYRQRHGYSKIKPVRDTLAFLALILRMMMYFNPLKAFVPLALLFFILFCGTFIYDITHVGFTDKTILLALGSLIFMCIGLIGDLIVNRSNIHRRED